MMTIHRKRKRDDNQKTTLSTEQVRQSMAALSSAFSKAIYYWPPHKNYKGTPLYDLQVEYCWLMREIADGPPYIVTKNIQEMNHLIAKAEKLQRENFGPLIDADTETGSNFS